MARPDQDLSPAQEKTPGTLSVPRVATALRQAGTQKAGVAAFILTSGDLHGDEMSQIFVKALPGITRFLQKLVKPFIAKITKDGSIMLLF